MFQRKIPLSYFFVSISQLPNHITGQTVRPLNYQECTESTDWNESHEMNVKRAQIVECTQKALHKAPNMENKERGITLLCIHYPRLNFTNNSWLSFKLHFTSHQTFNNIMQPLTIISRKRHLLREPCSLVICLVCLFCSCADCTSLVQVVFRVETYCARISTKR